MAPCVEPGLRPQRRSEDATGSSALIANGFEVLGWGTFLDSISSYKGSHLGEGCLNNANAVVRPQDVAQRAPPVGTDLRAVRHLRRGAFGEIALPRRCSGKAGFVEGLWDVAQRASPVGTDLRAVRRLRRGAFGEIALPRRCSGKAGFAEGLWDVAR